MRKIDSVMVEINKKYGEILCEEGTSLIEVDKIPFSSPLPNYMTYGGIPIGKATELFGAEGSGKTTTALDLVKNAQIKFNKDFENKKLEYDKKINEMLENKISPKKVQKAQEEFEEFKDQGPKVVVYVDTENTLDVEWAQLLGVNTEEMILIRPQTQTAEQVLQIIIDLITTGNVGMLVLDSIPCLVPQIIFEESMEKKSYGGIAQPMAVFSARVSPLLTMYKVALVMINQEREDLSSPYNAVSTPGGRGLKHLYSLRLRFRKGSLLDDNNKEIPSKSENPSGNRVQIEIVKTKTCKPNRRLGFYTLNYTDGIDIVADTIELALNYRFIVQTGSWFTMMDPDTGEIITDEDGNDLKFQGIIKLMNYLEENDILLEELIDRVNEKISKYILKLGLHLPSFFYIILCNN